MNVRRSLAECLTGMGRYVEAEEELLAVHKRMHDRRGPQHHFTQMAIRSLVDLYEAWGKPEQAARWQAKLPAPTR